jgi:DNA-binding MurR/RpiR family transcriptional regulator
MSIVETIKNNLDDMTRSERQVATHYLGHAVDFAFCTLDSIAAKVDTSSTSVLRFCRRLGFEGFKDFQQAVRLQLHGLPELPDKFHRTVQERDGDDLFARTVAQDIHCLHESLENLSLEALTQAVGLLSQARRVYTFGMKESLAPAHYAYTRLLTVRPDVQLFTGGCSGEIEPILTMTKEDVCLVFLFHRYTRQSLQILELLHRRGIPVILVTNSPSERIEGFAKVLLCCRVDHGGIKNTAIVPIVLCDYFCDAVAAALGDQALQYMQQTEEVFRTGSVLGG